MLKHTLINLTMCHEITVYTGVGKMNCAVRLINCRLFILI